MKILLFMAIVVSVFTAGCGTDATTTAGGRDPDKVLVIKSAPKEAYVTLGTVTNSTIYVPHSGNASTMDMGGSDTVDVLVGLREHAAALGADAVILTDRHVEHPMSQENGESTRVYVTGTAIRFVRPGGAPAPAQGAK